MDPLQNTLAILNLDSAAPGQLQLDPQLSALLIQLVTAQQQLQQQFASEQESRQELQVQLATERQARQTLQHQVQAQQAMDNRSAAGSNASGSNSPDSGAGPSFC